MNKGLAHLLVATICATGLPVFAQSGSAKPSCAPGDAVVWENTNTKAYLLPGDKYYGNTKHGAYACRSAADSGGYHLAGSKGASKSTGSMPSAMTSFPVPMASATPSGQHHHGKHHQKSGEMASPPPLPTAT